MATFIVTTSDSGVWDDDKRNQCKTRRMVEARVGELLATRPVVRVIRWESGRPVHEERYQSPSAAARVTR